MFKLWCQQPSLQWRLDVMWYQSWSTVEGPLRWYVLCSELFTWLSSPPLKNGRPWWLLTGGSFCRLQKYFRTSQELPFISPFISRWKIVLEIWNKTKWPFEASTTYSLDLGLYILCLFWTLLQSKFPLKSRLIKEFANMHWNKVCL